MHRYHIYILYLLLGICLMSCDNNAPVGSPNTDMLLMLSRADMTSCATYGVMVYDGDTRYRYGNYTFDSERNELIPYSKVDDNLILDYNKGVYVPTGTYKMVLTSPAFDIVDRDDPSKKWTFEYVRMPESDDYTPLYVSNAFSVDIYNRGEIFNNTYCTFVDLTTNHDIHLKERRSLVNLIIECGDKITETMIKDVKIGNLIKRAVYNPDTDCFEDDALAKDNIEEIELISNEDIVLSHDGTEYITLPYASNSEKTVEGNNYIYVLSQDYREVVSYGVFRHVTPAITIKFKDDAESIIPLNANIEPHKRYTCKILIQSNYTGVNVIVEPWNNGTAYGGIGTLVDDDNTSIINIGNYDITPWDSNGSQHTTIGGDTD